MMPWPFSALLDHLWQSTLFAGGAGLLTLGLRRYQARVCYWIWVSTSIKFLLPLSMLVQLGAHLRSQDVSPRFEPVVTFVMDQVLTPTKDVIDIRHAPA